MERKNPVFIFARMLSSHFQTPVTKEISFSTSGKEYLFSVLKKMLVSVFLILGLLSLSSVAEGQTTRYWVGGAAASFTNAGSWSTALGGAGNGAPVAGDVLIVDGTDISSAAGLQTGAVTMNSFTALSIRRLILQNNANATLTAAAAQTLTITNGLGTDLVINTGSSFTNSTWITLTLANPATATIDGTLTVGLGRTFNTNVVGVVTTVNGSIINTGVINGSATGLIFNSGSVYNHSRDGGVIPTATWDVASNCNITGLTATAPTGGMGQTFGNFNYSSSYVLPLAANLTVAGNLDISAASINASTFTIGLTGSLTGNNGLSFTTGLLNIGGNFTNIGPFTCGTGTVTYNGAAQLVRSTTYGGLTLSGSGNKSMAGDVTVGGLVNFLAGSLILNDHILNINGTTSVTAGTITGSPASDINVTSTNNLGIALPAISGGLQNLIINKTGTTNTVTLGSDLDISGAATFTNGALVLNGRSLNLNGTTSLGAGTITGSATSIIQIGSSDNSGMVLPAITGGLLDFVLNKTGTTNTVTLGSNIITAGSLTLSDGSLLLNNYSLTLNGTLNQTSGTITGGGTSDIFIGTPAGAAITLPGVINGIRNFTLNRTAGIKLTGPNTINGTLTLTTGALKLDTYNLTLANTIAIAGAPFGVGNMIETGGTGRLIRSANATNQTFNQTYPVGSGGYYSPLIITGLPNIPAAIRTISVGAVPSNLGVTANSINRYWDLAVINITTNAGTVLSFAYNAGEVVGNPLVIRPYTNTSGSWGYATGPSAPEQILQHPQEVQLLQVYGLSEPVVHFIHTSQATGISQVHGLPIPAEQPVRELQFPDLMIKL